MIKIKKKLLRFNGGTGINQALCRVMLALQSIQVTRITQIAHLSEYPVLPSKDIT